MGSTGERFFVGINSILLSERLREQVGIIEQVTVVEPIGGSRLQQRIRELIQKKEAVQTSPICLNARNLKGERPFNNK